jgi:lipid-binding SYLF domain-containing protein
MKPIRNCYLLWIALLGIPATAVAQVGGWNPELRADADTAMARMIEKTPRLATYRDKAYGYALFPRVTKGGIGIGGAVGKGVVYIGGQPVGTVKLKQASWGFQFGGQQYSEVIFFEDAAAFENFRNNKLKFDAQASAVAIKEGVSRDAAYNDGVAVFTQTIGGLMYEASIGGQHFSYEPIGAAEEGAGEE